MDILIPDSWLRKFLKTTATPKKLAEYLSFSGPSVDRISKINGDHVYHIEINTNRVDSAGVFGIAREAFAILPTHKQKATLLKPKVQHNLKFKGSVDYLDAKVDPTLCSRFSAILVKNVQIGKSPSYIQKHLEAVGVRPINNIIDISNYIMHELGQPVHTFDYDKIKGAKMVLRKSVRGEQITTLDGKTHTLEGGDIVIEDGEGRLIDLAGIMGGKNSEVDENTKNVLLFVQTYNPVNIRKTSMSLAKRSEAAVLFEKDLDPEGVENALLRGVDLFKKLTKATPVKYVLDIYPKPYVPKKIKVDLSFIETKMGVELEKKEVKKILESLGFEVAINKDELEILIPSFRANDISIPEDIVEEVARLYGYHNLPGILMEGSLPEKIKGSPFDFEIKLKRLLEGWGGVEVYTSSLVPEKFTENDALKLKNPLGKESEYMRTSLLPSLVSVAKDNRGRKDPFFVFEMANIYLNRKSDLPDERITLGGIFSNYSYREAKGIVEALLKELNIKADFQTEDSKYFAPAKRIIVKKGNIKLGEFGILQNNNFIFFNFDVETLEKFYTPIKLIKGTSKYPPQIEDITFILPSRTKAGEVLTNIKSSNKNVKKVVLTDIYKDSFTFRVWYQDANKTLTNKDVEKIRISVIGQIKKRYGAEVKD